MGCCKKKGKAVKAASKEEENRLTLAVVFIDACLDGNFPKVKKTFE